MADTTNRIIMEAVDKASKIIDKVGESIGDSGKQFKAFADQIPGLNAGLSLLSNPLTLAGAGIAAAGKFASDATNETLEYNKSIRELSTNLGISTEQTSRLVQTADDFTVSQTDLTVALEMALKNGFAPSVETLAKMADAYNNINDPTERAAELTKVFGRNWAALTPMLKEGGDAIREAAASQSKSLLVTEQASQKTREFEVAMDALGDSMQGIKYQVGNALIPPLVEAANTMNAMIVAQTLWDAAAKRGLLEQARFAAQSDDLAKNVAALTKLIEEYDAKNKEAFQNVIDLTTGTANLTDAERLQAFVLSDMTDRQKTANTETEKAIEHVKGYSKSWMDASEWISKDYIKKIENAVKQVPTTLNMNLNLGGSIDSFIDEIKFQSAGGGKLQQAFEDVKRLWLVDQAITEEEALTYFKALEAASYTTMVTIGEMTKSEAATAISEGLNIPYSEAWKLIGQPVQDVLDDINKDIKINVDAYLHLYGDTQVIDLVMNSNPNKPGEVVPIPKAEGGDVYAGTPYMVGDGAEPELFIPSTDGTIVPKHNMMGGGSQINIYFQAPVSSQAEARAGATQGVLAAMRASGRA